MLGWNRTPDRADAPAAEGLVVAASPREAAEGAELLITMVADPAALRDVVEGEDGIAAGAGGALTVVEMSTVGPQAVERLADALPAETGLLDAPVLGSITEAEAGSLTIFVGGPPDVVERAAPILAAVGTPLHVGELGSGARAKLVANSTLLGTLAVLGEALELGGALGLDRSTVFDVLARTPLAAQAERRRHSVEAFDYPLRFPLSLARKDADLIAEAAARAGRRLPLAEAVRRLFLEAEEAGWGGYDYSSLLTWLAVREPDPPRSSL